MSSSKNFKYGERKHKKLKQKMKLYNINKHISKLRLNNGIIEDASVGDDLEEENNACLGSNIKNVAFDEEIVDSVVAIDMQMMEDNLSNNVAASDNMVQFRDSGDSDVAGHNTSNRMVDGADDLESSDHAIENEIEAVIEDIENNVNNDISIEGRRIVELNFLVDQLREISDHNLETCSFSDIRIEKEIRNGLRSKIIFRCTKCHESFQVFNSEALDSNQTMSINTSAVLGSNMVGIGYSQLEQFASVVEIPVMCSGNFKTLNDKIGEYWVETAEQSMKEAAEEERRAAIERGDVDKVDGKPFATVVIDGTWCKRAYNKNFSALSGVAAIVGLFTGKVLWIGVKNKYCVTCVRSANKNVPPPVHFCTKNYSGSSSDMEWKSIVEGFQSSVELHDMRYLKVVGDGDSSTYSKLMEHKPYGNRYIEKFECKNHLLRNFRKQLEVATRNTPRGLNKHVCDNLDRIRKDVNSAIIYRNSEDTTTNQKILLLKNDIQNVLHHVFGDHSNCPSYIKEHCKNDNNYIPALIQCGTYEKMSKVMRKLMYCASDLILGHTNNAAEHYNSIVAKFVGGKRVNFSLSNSYKYKANAAAVQYNEKLPLSALYKTVLNTDPPVITNKIQLKRLKKTQREKERRKRNKQNKIIPKRFNRVKDNGSGYGERCQTTDLSAADYENEKRIILEKLKRNQEERISIEERTRENHKCDLWIEVSTNMITASDFGSICKARDLAVHVKNIARPSKFAQTKAMKHDEESQPIAQKQLSTEQNIRIQKRGLFIDSELMYLAAVPTGIVSETDMIVHIQCPSSIFNMDPNDHSVLAKLPYMQLGRDKTTILGLKKTDSIYYEIQGQLHICQKNVCLFSIWTSSQHKMYVEWITRDKIFFDSKAKSQLDSFYHNWLLPELTDSRLKRNMEIRVPTGNGVPA